jgi:hypothetical protein
MKTGAQEVDFDVPGRTKPCPPHCVAAAKLAERSVLTGSSVAPAAYRRVANNTAGDPVTDVGSAGLAGVFAATPTKRPQCCLGHRQRPIRIATMRRLARGF